MERFFSQYRPENDLPPATPGELERCRRRLGFALPSPLEQFLSKVNGGYFRRGVLHVMGACRPLRHEDLATWNQPHDWKAAFAHYDLKRYLFFADDVFGNQFGCLIDEGNPDPEVWRFDIQVGEFVRVAATVSAFFQEVVIEDGDWLLGGDYLRAYLDHGQSLQPGQHLSLVIPSLLGGTFEPENLRAVDPATNLYLAGQVLTQIKPLPAGTEIRGFRFDPSSRQLQFETR
jgi:hypothetical protein